jgi:DNA-binding response OmpR family regulator
MNKILIVEDERSIRQALRFELEDEGYEVYDAVDYPEAVSAFHAFNCDLVVSDLFLSQGDGIQLWEDIQCGQRQIPFIGITAFPDTRLAVKAKNLLDDRLFIKPFISSALKDKINELLNKNTATRAV